MHRNSASGKATTLAKIAIYIENAERNAEFFNALHRKPPPHLAGRGL